MRKSGKATEGPGTASLKAWLAALSKSKKRNKYGARKKEYDGKVFDSLRECERYKELRLLEKGKKIIGLEVHPVFVLEVNNIKVGKFSPDFSYLPLDSGDGLTVEDVKSKPTKTEAYRLRVKVFKACYPEIEFKEVF